MDFIGTYEGKEITKMQPRLLGCWRREGLIVGRGPGGRGGKKEEELFLLTRCPVIHELPEVFFFSSSVLASTKT